MDENENEIDSHFQNRFITIEQNLQNFIEKQTETNELLLSNLNEFKDKILTGNFTFDTLDQLKIDQENFKLLLESMENDITSLNVDKLVVQVNKVKSDVESLLAKNTSYFSKFKQDIDKMASLTEVKEVFDIINNEIYKYRSRTDNELDKKIDKHFVEDIMKQIKHIGSNLNNMSFIQTKKLGHS